MNRLILAAVTALFVLAMTIPSAAQTWVHPSLGGTDAGVTVTRAVEGDYFRWTYEFEHYVYGPTDYVWECAVNFLTLEPFGYGGSAVDGIQDPGEHYWDYTGVFSIDQGPWQQIPSIQEFEVVPGLYSQALWDATQIGEDVRMTVSFLTDLPGVGLNYAKMDGGASHADDSVEVPNIPEPASLLALAGALGVFAAQIRRKH